MTTADFLALCSMLVALVAVFLGPLLAGWMSHRQIVAQMRQNWINDLRNSVADYIAEGNDPTLQEPGEFDHNVFKKLNYLENKIELMLNPEELVPKRLVAICHDYLSVLMNCRKMKEKEFFDRKAEIELEMTALTQQIILAEWRKTKNVFRS